MAIFLSFKTVFFSLSFFLSLLLQKNPKVVLSRCPVMHPNFLKTFVLPTPLKKGTGDASVFKWRPDLRVSEMIFFTGFRRRAKKEERKKEAAADRQTDRERERERGTSFRVAFPLLMLLAVLFL